MVQLMNNMPSVGVDKPILMLEGSPKFNLGRVYGDGVLKRQSQALHTCIFSSLAVKGRGTMSGGLHGITSPMN